MYLLLFYSTTHISEHNSRRNPTAFFLYLPKQKNTRKLSVQCMPTETIAKRYAKPFAASQNRENLFSAKKNHCIILPIE